MQSCYQDDQVWALFPLIPSNGQRFNNNIILFTYGLCTVILSLDHVIIEASDKQPQPPLKQTV